MQNPGGRAGTAPPSSSAARRFVAARDSSTARMAPISTPDFSTWGAMASSHFATPVSTTSPVYSPAIGRKSFPCTLVCTSARRRIACKARSEEHTSELQSHLNLVCRLLLEKKKPKNIDHSTKKKKKKTKTTT